MTQGPSRRSRIGQWLPFPHRGREVIVLNRLEALIEAVRYDRRCHQQSQGGDRSGDQFRMVSPHTQRPRPDRRERRGWHHQTSGLIGRRCVYKASQRMIDYKE